MKKWQSGLLFLVVLIFAFCLYVFVQLRSIEVERLTDDLFVLRGLGGNTAVLRTDAGAVVVDSMMLPMQGKRIRAPGQGADRTGYRPADQYPLPHRSHPR